MRFFPRLAFYVLIALNATNALSQQSSASPTNAGQKPILEAHDQCIEANDKAYKLYSISQLMMEARQNKVTTERVLASEPQLAGKYKSYEKALSDGMALYRLAGGTAQTIDDIKPVENPCPASAPKAMQSGISKKMRKSHIKPGGHSVGNEPSRKSNDARACTELESNRAIMACAEKFR